MIDSINIAWIAGILEGEGCFRLNGTTPTIQLSMTDEDIVSRVSDHFKRDYVKYYIPGYKTQYRVAICSDDAISWMMTIYKFMGNRKRLEIKLIIDSWKERFKNKGICKRCGSVRVYHKEDNCKRCMECDRETKRRWYYRTRYGTEPPQHLIG